jgi:hypothetical protein
MQASDRFNINSQLTHLQARLPAARTQRRDACTTA